VAIFGAFALVATPALADPVTLAPVSFSPEFQSDLEDRLGAREGETLRDAVEQALTRSLARRGASVGSGSPTLLVEVSILDADPNRPTFQQLSDTPGLDMGRSISIGGAELRGVLRNAQGEVVSEVTHRRYDQTLEHADGSSTWTAARRAIRQFAEKVGDAYAAGAN
jgi:hypothetical protein